MEAEIEGKNLIIIIPFETPLPRSSSGKTLLLSSPVDKEKFDLEVPSYPGLNTVNISVTAWMYPPSEHKTLKGRQLTPEESEAVMEHNRQVTKKMEAKKKKRGGN